ncbi:MAG: DUF3987 domain-containing protein [Prevotella sp.]|nr:DUF3987 domain-containing protein [Prevotella sp.]
MAVNRIILRDNKKVCVPILKKSEYYKLRDVDFNRQCVEKARNGETFTTRSGEQKSFKTLLEQFNYSCYPNEDGTLKGTTKPADSVGMDIDFQIPSELPEGVTPEKWIENEILNISKNILDKKEEIGLLLCERSATKGLHIVFRRDISLDQEGNLRRVSDVLGVPFDEAAKDITRVFFTPTSADILYIAEGLFERGDGGTGTSGNDGGKTKVSRKKDTERNESRPEEEKPIKENLIVFDLLVKEAGLDPKGLDVFGEHNWHKNLMSIMSLGMAKMMSREQAFAVVNAKLPNYSQEGDCANLINYFYDNYNTTKFMSPTLREINASAQYLARQKVSEDDREMAELMEGWDAPKLPEKLPPLIEMLVSNYDKRFREMLCLSSLPVLSAHASHYRAQYLNGRVIGPQQYVAVIGGSGSGKGNCTALYKDMIENTLAAHDALEWEKVKANQEERDTKANAKEKPAKYHPKLRLFETASKSSILELQTNLGKNGMLLGQFSEVDGLSNAAKAVYSDISVLLRKGWDMDMHRQFYMSEASCNTHVQMSISLLMAGTIKAMLERLFSENNREGGLMQRCIPVLVPTQKRTFRPPKQNFLTAEERRMCDNALMELYQKDVALGDEVQILDLPLTTKAIGQWFDELEMRYNDGLLTDAEADLSHRCGEFMMRAAIPLVALYGKESAEIVAFARWVGDFAHYTMCRLFGHSVQKNIESANQLINKCKDHRKTAEPILSIMPETFSLKQFKEIREKNGQNTNVRAILHHYVKCGKLERLDRGMYRKMSNVKV